MGTTVQDGCLSFSYHLCIPDSKKNGSKDMPLLLPSYEPELPSRAGCGISEWSGLRAVVCMSGALGGGLSWDSVWGFININKVAALGMAGLPKDSVRREDRAPRRLGNKDGQRK